MYNKSVPLRECERPYRWPKLVLGELTILILEDMNSISLNDSLSFKVFTFTSQETHIKNNISLYLIIFVIFLHEIILESPLDNQDGRTDKLGTLSNSSFATNKKTIDLPEGKLGAAFLSSSPTQSSQSSWNQDLSLGYGNRRQIMA